MNRKPKTVLQRSIDCFATVEEYAKSRGKSSKSSVSSDFKSLAAVTQGARLLRLSAICAGLAAAGLSMQATAGCPNGSTGNGLPTGKVECGAGAKASGGSAIAIGKDSKAFGDSSLALGNNASTGTSTAPASDAEYSIAIGTSANSNFLGGVAIGSGAKVNSDNGVSLGRFSVAEAQQGSSFLTNVAADTTYGNLSVGRTATGNQLAVTRRITNVADGSAASDAVTVAQLDNVNVRTIINTNNIATNTSNIATNATNINRNTNAIGDLASGRTGMVQQNSTGTGNITVGAATGGTEVSFAGTQGDRVLTNVADGMAPRDAVNIGQLNGMERRLGNSINELGYRIDDVEDDANAGISAAMAMSSLPQSNMAGRSMIGGGIATYNGESAVAVGISRVSDNGRWAMKINGTADTQGNAGGAIGAGFHF